MQGVLSKWKVGGREVERQNLVSQDHRKNPEALMSKQKDEQELAREAIGR